MDNNDRDVATFCIASLPAIWAITHFSYVTHALWHARLNDGYYFPSKYGSFHRFVCSPNNAYWWYLVSLWFVSIGVVFQYRHLVNFLSSPGTTEMQSRFPLFVFYLASLSFPIPIVLAFCTAHLVAGNVDHFPPSAITHVGLVAFVFYALLQVIAVGSMTNKEQITNRLLSAGRMAIPIVSFVFSAARLLYDAMQTVPR